MTNPFAQNVPANTQPTPSVDNPFATTAPVATPAVGSNPFASPPQQYSPPAALPSLPPVTAAPPAVVSDGRGANLPDMYGRLVLMFPLCVETVPRRPEHITPEQHAAGNVNQQRATVTVVVLDDGNGGMTPIAYGGAPYKMPPTAHTDSSPLPYVRRGMWLNQTRILSQLVAFLPTTPGGPPGAVCGRVLKVSPEQNAAWYLSTPTEADLALANRYMQGAGAGEFPHPLAA